jgi:hypothetical protein
MSEPVAIPPRPATAESTIIWDAPKAGIHEFWTRAGEVKNLAREFERLKQAASVQPAAIAQTNHV